MAFQPAKKSINKEVVFEAQDVKYNEAKDSGAMKQMLGNKKIAQALNESSEKNEFYRVLKEEASKSGGRVTKDALRKTMGRFKYGKGAINSGEAKQIADEFSGVLGNRRYILSKEEKTVNSRTNAPDSSKNNPVVNPRDGRSSMARPGSSSGKSVARHSRLF